MPALPSTDAGKARREETTVAIDLAGVGDVAGVAGGLQARAVAEMTFRQDFDL